MARDQTGYLQFLVYLDETGLDETVREICRRHHVSVRDVYLDAKGPTVTAARLEIWFWLRIVIGKSNGEIGRMFGRDGGSIGYAFHKLVEQAKEMGLELNRETAPDVARAFAVRGAKNLERSGKRVASIGLRARHHRPIDGEGDGSD